MVNGTPQTASAAEPLNESERVRRVRELRNVVDGAFLAISRAIVEMHKLDCAAYIHVENTHNGATMTLVAPLDRAPQNRDVDIANLHAEPAAVQ